MFLVWNTNVGCRSSSHKKPSFDAALEFNVAYVATGTGLVRLLKESKVGCGADTVLSSNRAICGIVNCSTKGFRKAHRISDPFNVLTLSRGEALQVYLLIIPRFGLLCCCDKPSLSVSVHGGSVNIFHSEMLGTTSGLIRCFATETS